MYISVRWVRKELVPRFPDDPTSLVDLNLSDLALSGEELNGLHGEPCASSTLNLNLAFNRLVNLDCVKGFMRLVKLNVSHNSISSLEGIAHLKELKVLDCSFNSIEDLSIVGDCLTNLVFLKANNNKIKTLCGVEQSESKMLETIIIYNNPCCENFEEMLEFTSSKVISLSNGALVKHDGLLKKETEETRKRKKSGGKGEQSTLVEVPEDELHTVGEEAEEYPQTNNYNINNITCEDEASSSVAGQIIKNNTQTIKNQQQQSSLCRTECDMRKSACNMEILNYYTKTGKEAIWQREDGGCTVRWPNGSIAISIEPTNCSATKARTYRTLCITEKGQIVASFDEQAGSGTLNFENGKTYLSIATTGQGLVMNRKQEIVEIFDLKKPVDNRTTTPKRWELCLGNSLGFLVEINQNSKYYLKKIHFKCQNINRIISFNDDNNTSSCPVKLLQATDENRIIIAPIPPSSPLRKKQRKSPPSRPLPNISDITSGLDDIEILKK